MTTFTTSLDKFNKTTTIIVFVIILAIMISIFFLTPENEQDMAILFAFVPLISTIVVYVLRPNNYSISSNKLLIHRAISNVEIDRNNIQSVREIEDSQVKNSIRTFGAGGFFGNFGKFWNSQLGNMTWYVTRKNNFV